MNGPDHGHGGEAGGHRFGTVPVFLASISTILDAVMFLRFGLDMIVSGRLPISPKNLHVIPTDAKVDFHHLVESRSADADLGILGLTADRLGEKGTELMLRHPALKDVLFVSARQRILID